MTVSIVLMIALAFANAQSPVLATYAYSGATAPGIPQGKGVAASP